MARQIPKSTRQTEPRTCANCGRTVHTKSGAPEVFCKLCMDYREEEEGSLAEYAATRLDQDQ